MEQQEYDELLRRLDARQAEHMARMARMDVRIELLETFQEQQQRLLEKMDARQDDLAARQQIHEDIMKSLAATLVKQDTINDRLTANMERLDRTNERLEGILVGIRDLLSRGNGRTEG
jgi:chromosome segregation ATPase